MVCWPYPPEPRPKARYLPTRLGARDVGAEANRIRLVGPAFRASGRRIWRVPMYLLIRQAAADGSVSETTYQGDELFIGAKIGLP